MFRDKGKGSRTNVEYKIALQQYNIFICLSKTQLFKHIRRNNKITVIHLTTEYTIITTTMDLEDMEMCTTKVMKLK